MSTNSFDLEAGELCLDFANTVEWHASDHPEDKLSGFADLVAWAEAAKILSAENVGRLRHLAEERPDRAKAVFGQAIQLRETIYRLFAGYSEQAAFAEKDLDHLNKILRIALSHLQVVPAAEGFEWGWEENPETFDRVLWPVARSAGTLLTSDRMDRVRQCADDRGCGYLFVDTSRNHSRRWCSMESCGNRAKAQRHYKRQKKES